MLRRRWAVRAALAGATALALALAPGVAGAAMKINVTTYGYRLMRGGYNANESALGLGNASGLHKLWSFDIGGATISEPTMATGVRVNGHATDLVFTGSENGFFYAVNAATGKQVWKRNLGHEQTGCSDMPNDTYGVSSTPSIDMKAGRVYVAGGIGKLFALSLATGATVAGWPLTTTTAPQLEYVYSAITLSNGMLYVETASYCDATPYHGRIEAFDIAARRRAATWYVTGKGGPSGGGIWGEAGLAVDSSGNVYTATGNAMISPENFGHAEAVVRLSSSLHVQASDKQSLTGGDVDFGASPVLFKPPGCPLELAVENKSGVLFVYQAGSIGSGPLQALQVGNVGDWQFNAIPAYDPTTNMLYVADLRLH